MGITKWLADHIPEGAIIGMLAIIRWLGMREIKRIDDELDSNTKDIADLKKDKITTRDFDELRGSMTASITTAFELLDKNVERRHSENRDDRESLLSGIRSEIESVRTDVRLLWRAKSGSD